MGISSVEHTLGIVIPAKRTVGVFLYKLQQQGNRFFPLNCFAPTIFQSFIYQLLPQQQAKINAICDRDNQIQMALLRSLRFREPG
jgi:hypothetical protein